MFYTRAIYNAQGYSRNAIIESITESKLDSVPEMLQTTIVTASSHPALRRARELTSARKSLVPNVKCSLRVESSSLKF